MNRTAHAQWALEQIIDIDRYTPFCGAFFRASGERRQIIAAYLSAQPPSQEEMAQVGKFLLEADHRSILAAAHGEYLQGSRGALRRAGETVVEERFYSLLHQTLAKPPHKNAVRAIARLPRLSLSHLLAIRLLPEAICYAEVIKFVDGPMSSHESNDAKTAFELLISSGVDGMALALALRQARSPREFSKVWETFLLKVSAPKHPVEANEWYRPVTSGADLHRMAVKYRNCSRRYTVDILDPTAGHAFAEVRDGHSGAMVHLRKEGPNWHLDGLYGSRNARPGRSLYRTTEDYLAAQGVKITRQQKRGNSDWDALRRLSPNRFEFDFE